MGSCAQHQGGSGADGLKPTRSRKPLASVSALGAEPASHAVRGLPARAPLIRPAGHERRIVAVTAVNRIVFRP